MPPSKRDLQEQRDQDAREREHLADPSPEPAFPPPARPWRLWLALLVGLVLGLGVLVGITYLAARPDASSIEYRMEPPR
jgi:hypothetical protein